MNIDFIWIGLAGVLVTTAPVIFAVVGETLTERAGVINLSLNGLILLSAMASFAVASTTQSLWLGFLAGAGVGAVVSLIVAFCSITLRQSQVAVGFVLALLCRDLAYFLGNPFINIQGPVVSSYRWLNSISVDAVTVFSVFVIVGAWFWIFHTRPGLVLRGVGERPSAAYVRGVNVNRVRYFYTILGGAIVGLAGPAYSLSVKAGWRGTISGLDGIGWIALAVVIFGGWNPIRAAAGAYLFGLLQWLGVVLQPVLPGVPSQVLQVAPFPVMILTLVFVNFGNGDWGRHVLPRILRSFRVLPPASLGVPFQT